VSSRRSIGRSLMAAVVPQRLRPRNGVIADRRAS
jgi:hypothetical protein